MTDEEKKAIHDLKSGLGILNCITGIEKDETDIKAIEIILNLIEKQDNKIKELESDKGGINEKVNNRIYR